MKRMHIWVVEAQYISKPGSRWKPVLRFGLSNPIRGAHLTRFMARKAAKKMQETNMYNKPHPIVRYRVRKYEAA